MCVCDAKLYVTEYARTHRFSEQPQSSTCARVGMLGESKKDGSGMGEEMEERDRKGTRMIAVSGVR